MKASPRLSRRWCANHKCFRPGQEPAGKRYEHDIDRADRSSARLERGFADAQVFARDSAGSARRSCPSCSSGGDGKSALRSVFCVTDLATATIGRPAARAKIGNCLNREASNRPRAGETLRAQCAANSRGSRVQPNVSTTFARVPPLEETGEAKKKRPPEDGQDNYCQGSPVDYDFGRRRFPPMASTE
jgi:hypothetical protein